VAFSLALSSEQWHRRRTTIVETAESVSTVVTAETAKPSHRERRETVAIVAVFETDRSLPLPEEPLSVAVSARRGFAVVLSDRSESNSGSTRTVSPVVDVTAIDPDTGQSWPVRFDTKGTTRYLQLAHNLPIAALTLVRQRSQGVGIRWKYLGQKPIAERTEVDRYVREEALKEVSPLRPGAQARATRKRQEQRRWSAS
jgi:hypothetical protein